MRKRRGAALPGAIALVTMLLIVSITVTATIVTISTLNTINRLEANNEMEFLNMHERFVNGDGALPEPISDTYRYQVYSDESDRVNNEYVKALVAWKKNVDEVKYYSIVDFSDVDNPVVLAYQTNYLYIIEDENYQYLGDYLAIPRSYE